MILWLLLLFSLLPLYNAEAVCTGASPTWTCPADTSSLQQLINSNNPGAVQIGDTINLAAGTHAPTTTVAATKGAKFNGQTTGCPSACVNNTILKNTTGGSLITYLPVNLDAFQANMPISFSGITFDANGSANPVIEFIKWGQGTNTYPMQTKLRIDHNNFTNGCTGSSSCMFIKFGAFYHGVGDHNRFANSQFFARYGFNGGVLAEQTTIWRDFPGVRFGEIDNTFWWEDNLFATAPGSGQLMDCIDGFRYSARYNTLTAGYGDKAFDQHGNNGSDNGCFGGEFYGNDMGSPGSSIVDQRGGIMFVHHNQDSGSSGKVQTRDEQDGWSADPRIPSYTGPGAPPCPVTLPHTPGRCQDVWGSYAWGNRSSNGTGSLWPFDQQNAASVLPPKTTSIPVAGVDYFDHTTSPAVTEGTFAARPANCVTGQAYWATNQSTTNLSGMTGVNHSTQIAGTWYQCPSPPNWDSGTSLLAWPHPLAAAGSDTTPPSDVTNPSAVPVNTSQINVDWDDATDNVLVDHYNVERCSGAGCVNFVQIASPLVSNLGDTGLAASTLYRYRIKAVDSSSNQSTNYSSIVQATTNSPTTTLKVFQGGLNLKGGASMR